MKTRTCLRTITGIFLLSIFFLNTQTAFADWTISGSNSFTGAVSVAMPITDLQISGDPDTVPVKLRVTSGTLQMTTTTGLTFTGGTSGSTLQFTGTLANVNAALATLRYTRGSVGTDTLEVSLVSPGEVFFSDNGHLYEYISQTTTWTQARDAALLLTRYGANGYLTTITSQNENDFVAARLANAGWMGASDAGTEGTWKWVTGPENNTTFWQGVSNGSTVGGNYANWGTGEPNDFNNGVPGEDCGQFLSGGSGRWNDLPCSGTTLPGYVVEFGAPGNMPTVVAKNISISTVAAPIINTFTPADNATNIATSTNLTLAFSKTVATSTGNISIKKTSDDTTVETIPANSSRISGGGTATIVVDPTSLEESTGYYILVDSTLFVDTVAQNYAGISSKTVWNFTTGDFTAPAITAVASSTASTTAQITWSTNESASSRVEFGLTSNYGTSTPTQNTSPRVTSHTVNLTNLVACSTYYFRLTSADTSSNSTTTSRQSFTTTGCTASTTPQTTTSNTITTSTGGTTSLTEEGSTFRVTAPSNFTTASSSLVIQIISLPREEVLGSIGKPRSSYMTASDIVFDVKAIIDSVTVLDSFDTPVTIYYEYQEEDIAGIDESTLWLYHYHNSGWERLNDCVVNTNANSIECTAPGFSIFSLFGSPVVVAQNSGNGPIFTGLASSLPGYVAPRMQTVYPDGTVVYQDAPSAPTAVQTTGEIQKSTCPVYPFTRVLRRGMRGEDVKALQELLNCLGFKLAEDGPGSPGQETTLFSNLTFNSVSRLQDVHPGEILTPVGLTTSSGIFGNSTQAFVKGR